MKKPDFFIVGAPKCGTTAMHHYLGAHPEIFMPKFEETHFFCSDIKYKRPRISELDYLSLFVQARDEKRVGDRSTWYLYSKKAASEIKKFCPFADIIVMLRNPVDMLYSLHSQYLYNGNEDIEDFKEALAAEGDRRQGLRIPEGSAFDGQLCYREVAKYTEQLERYFDIFGRKKVFVIIFDDFIKDTSKVYDETLQFLGVDPDFRPDFRVLNPSKRVYSKTLRRFLQNPPEIIPKFSRTVLPGMFQGKLFKLLWRMNIKHAKRQPMDPKLRKRLQNAFAPEVECLSELLGRDLTHWVKT
jgi:hypothetical protein